MLEVTNMFREFSMLTIAGYKELSEKHKQLFDKTYKRHMMTVDSPEKKWFTENNIEKIVPGNDIIKVYFQSGSVYIYSPDYTWLELY